MRVVGSTLEVTPEEAEAIRGIIASGLPVFDGFGPSQVSKLRELMGEETYQAVREATKHPKPNLLGLAVVVVRSEV